MGIFYLIRFLNVYNLMREKFLSVWKISNIQFIFSPIEMSIGKV
jgi:hypothetical protein